MAFTVINSSEIVSGEPVSSTTATKIKDNFDDHEARLLSIEGGAGTTYPPLIFAVNGAYKDRSGFGELCFTTTNFPMEVTGIRLIIIRAGSAGITEADVQFKRGGGAWTSLLTTKPSVSYSSGDYAISSNAVLNSSYTTLEAGDLLRINLSSAQARGMGFIVRVDYLRA